MRNIIISLFAVSLISGCSTTSSPKPHKTKYAFQCLLVKSPDSLIQELTFDVDESAANLTESIDNQTANLLQGQLSVPSTQTAKPHLFTLTQTQVEELLTNPDVEIVEFPVVYAGVGESVTNDQTTTKEMAIDVEVVDGEVVYTKKPFKFGESASITVNKVDGNIVSCKIDIMSQKFKAFEEIKAKDGLTFKMPYFKRIYMNTEITLSPNEWKALSGLIDQKNDGPRTYTMLIIQTIPPTLKNI